MGRNLGLKYVSSAGIRGQLFFYIMQKRPGENGGVKFLILVQEKTNISEAELPIYEFTGYYNAHKGTYSLYPRRVINRSVLEFPFVKHEIDAQFLFDVSTMRQDLPPELRAADMLSVSGDTNLDDIF